MNLNQRQVLSQEAEKKMLEWLLQYMPTLDLKVSDVKAIAHFCRAITFEMLGRDVD